MTRPTGYVVWQGSSPFDGSPIVAILTRKSSNRKTGDMSQLWVLRSDVSPTDAIKTGKDAAICGACPLRGDGTGKGRACYVTLAQAPTSVYRTFRKGGYPVASTSDLRATLSGGRVRLGAYGDPAMVPLRVIEAICSYAEGWTGYTHQWRTIDPVWRHYLMASSDTVSDRRDAREQGWRSFYVVPSTVDLRDVPKAVECMATRTRSPLQCADCLACAGTPRDRATGVDIVIRAHGTGSKYVGA